MEKDMKMNDALWEIEKAAEKECLELYPLGSMIDVQLRDNWRVMRCEITRQMDCTGFIVKDLETGIQHNFYPSCHPHKILRMGST